MATMAGRPVQFTSYLGHHEGAPGAKAWAWDPVKRVFVTTGGFFVSVSPDERWQATFSASDPRVVPQVRLLDRKTGVTTTVKLPVPVVPGRPQHDLSVGGLTWSPDSRHLLLDVGKSGDATRSEGIALIEVPSLKPRFVRIENALITVGGFQWTRDGKGVVVRWGKNGRSSIRRYDLDGSVRRTWHVRGRPAGDGQGAFTPSGRRFVTACMPLEKYACVWDTATGKAVTRIKLAFRPMGGNVLGWYDEHHLLATTRQGWAS
ncbi:hypothetical protein ACFQ0B_78155 [Nonomuraea thailandensis]